MSVGRQSRRAALIEQLRRERPGLRLLLTHTTATGREAGRALLRDGDTQRWLPFDTPGAVRRFLRRTRPAVGVLMETEIWPNVQREALKAWHFMLGLSVFVLAWVRLAVHLAGPVPAIVPEPSRWVSLSGKLIHAALYVLMIGLPLAGWLILSASGKPVPFFGLQLPALVGENKALADVFKEIHETGGTVGYFLIGLHAAAALFHHYVVRDNTLRRMLPFSSP